jgi:hypothetical protein
MQSRLLLKKNRLVQETAAKICAGLEPAYQDSLVRCLHRLDILSVRALGLQNLRLRSAPSEVALVPEVARPFGWAMWLAIFTNASLDDPEWLLAGLHRGSSRWGFTTDEARRWRREYIQAHTAASALPAGQADPPTALETVG